MAVPEVSYVNGVFEILRLLRMTVFLIMLQLLNDMVDKVDPTVLRFFVIFEHFISKNSLTGELKVYNTYDNFT